VTSPDRQAATLRLHLLRHADAGDPAKWTQDDAERPLSPKGEAQAERLGSFLAERGFVTDAVISSPLVRARQTAEIVASRLEVAVRLDERLGGGFAPEDVDSILADADGPRRPILVGHDPDFSELLAWLAQAHGVSMKKGAFARVDVRGSVSGGEASLRWLVPPDLLETISRLAD
jgi:phosphohistidine phosphatase